MPSSPRQHPLLRLTPFVTSWKLPWILISLTLHVEMCEEKAVNMISLDHPYEEWTSSCYHRWLFLWQSKHWKHPNTVHMLSVFFLMLYSFEINKSKLHTQYQLDAPGEHSSPIFTWMQAPSLSPFTSLFLHFSLASLRRASVHPRTPSWAQKQHCLYNTQSDKLTCTFFCFLPCNLGKWQNCHNVYV